MPVDVSLQLTGADVASYPRMSVTRTERGRLAELVGRVSFDAGVAELTVPPRSITTLLPSGAGPQRAVEGFPCVLASARGGVEPTAPAALDRCYVSTRAAGAAEAIGERG